jgi:hypothetical protein
MCSSSGPKPAPKTPEAPTMPNVDGGRDSAARKRRAANNSGTILTGSMGVTNPAPTTNKTLLGA